MPLDTVNDIRSMDAAGRSRSEIARMLHVSRNTVAKYADMEDMSPAAPMPRRRGRPALEGNEEWVAGVLEADLGAPRKQRHTARRIYDRLVAERGYGGSYSTVQRFVRELRLARAAACERRLEARFFTASSLVMRLRRARDDGRLDREAALIGKARLLVIDELWFLPLDADGARLLFQVFADAYERQSVVITTNLEFSRWGSVFGDDQMAAAVIDRIVHHGRLVQFRGESYRVRHALMQEG